MESAFADCAGSRQVSELILLEPQAAIIKSPGSCAQCKVHLALSPAIRGQIMHLKNCSSLSTQTQRQNYNVPQMGRQGQPDAGPEIPKIIPIRY